MTNKHSWKDDADCLDMEVNSFFDDYEENEEVRAETDAICSACPLARQCFAVGVSSKAWGVWGGIYLENGKISREFNRHRTKQQWAEKWQNLTMDN